MGRKATWPPPVYHHKPSGKDRVRIWKQGKAQDIVLGPHDSPEARAAYLRLVHSLETTGTTQPPDPALLSVSEVLARFWIYAEQHYAPEGRELANYRLSLQPLERLYGPAPAAAFDAPALEAVQRAMASGSWMTEAERAVRTRQGKSFQWCRNVVNQRINRIRTAWRWLERQKLLPAGSHAHLLTVPGLPRNAREVRHTPRVRPSELADVEKVAARCPPAVAAMLLLQWWAGMRSGEVRGMRIEDLDRSDPGCWLYTPLRDKCAWRDGREPRVVLLGPECQAILAPWLQAAGGYLFQGKPGTEYTASAYSRAVNRACRLAGVKITAYQGRHAAKRRITRVLGLDAARATLGQSSLGTTNQYAAGQDLELAREAARKLA